MEGQMIKQVETRTRGVTPYCELEKKVYVSMDGCVATVDVAMYAIP